MVLAVVWTACTSSPSTPTHRGSTSAIPSGSTATGRRPDIVLILTDDQRWDTLWAMPHVRSELIQKGIEFTNAFVSNSSCCPSRTTILTGDYSHTTGVYTNTNGSHGGFQAFDDRSTVATWLHRAGYRTALIGKYLNGYPAGSEYVPPGWDRWFAVGGEQGGYFDYDVSDQGKVSRYGSRQADYSTDVFARQATAFIRTTPPSQPLFLYFAPHAPHGPATPPARYSHRFADLPPPRPPSYNERDVTDKPAYIRALPLLGHPPDRLRRNQYRSLLAVDDAVNSIVQALRDTGRLRSTLILFSSDNGLTWGEHRLAFTKFTPYEEALRIPMIIRYDPLRSARGTDGHLVGNFDIAPTFAQVAGIRPPTTDGVSLVPLLSRTQSGWRTEFLLEHCCDEGRPGAPSFCGIRSTRYAYILYATGESELYDLKRDPYELRNAASDPVHRDVVAGLRSDLRRLCDPPPPGMAAP